MKNGCSIQAFWHTEELGGKAVAMFLMVWRSIDEGTRWFRKEYIYLASLILYLILPTILSPFTEQWPSRSSRINIKQISQDQFLLNNVRKGAEWLIFATSENICYRFLMQPSAVMNVVFPKYTVWDLVSNFHDTLSRSHKVLPAEF